METRAERNRVYKKVKKKRLNVARTLVLLLFIYIIVCLVMYVYKEPVRHYEISGNSYLSDMDIIDYLELDDYPSFVSLNIKSLKEKLEDNIYISSATVSYGYNFSLKIVVEENKPVFSLKLENKIMLSNGTKIDYDEDTAIGIPTVLNITPNDILTTLAENLKEVDSGILYMINEIEYDPSYNSSNQVIDEYRFLLSMNDKNLVYINAKRLSALNKYLDIIATNKITTNGTLYLDGTEDNYFFKIYTTTTSKVSDEDED